MASPITTSGFGVQVMPRTDFADPRLLTPNYGSIIPGVSQGLGAAGQFAQIYENAQNAPIRRQLAQIQLDEARAQAGLTPLIAARKRFELQQPIERVVGAGIEEAPRYMPQVMLDEVGQPMLDELGQPRTEVPAGVDIFATENIETIDPLTGARSVAPRRTRALQTMEQADASAAAEDYRSELARIRALQAETAAAAAAAKAENDRIKADAARVRAELLATNPAVSFVDVKREDGRTIRQYFPKGKPNEILHEIDRGELSSGGIFNFGGGVVNVGSGAPKVSGDIDSLVAQFGGAKKNLAASPTTSFSTIEEAESAARAGLLKNNTKITVGGKPATWKD